MMSRSQFLALWLVSVLLIGLVLTNWFLVRSNARLNATLLSQQGYINKASQAEPVLDNMAKRIAKGSDVDARLKNVLIKHGLKVTLDVDGKKKSYP